MGITALPKVLMSVRQEGNTLTLRIDQDRLLEAAGGDPPVTDLILFGCADIAASLPALARGVDQALDFEVHKGEEEKWAQFSLESAVEPVVVHCTGIIEVGSDYTLADWTQKCRRLLALDRAHTDDAGDYRRRFHALRTRLAVETTRGLERLQRRLLLSSPDAALKSAEIKAQVAIYQHIQSILADFPEPPDEETNLDTPD